MQIVLPYRVHYTECPIRIFKHSYSFHRIIRYIPTNIYRDCHKFYLDEYIFNTSNFLKFMKVILKITNRISNYAYNYITKI